MPVRMTPQPGDAVPTKKITPEEFDPAQEWFEVLVFLRQDVRDNALKVATKTITSPRGISRDEINNETYYLHLFKVQLKGWRLLGLDNEPIPFTEENINRLPWDLKSYLHEQILRCGGMIPTADLIVQTDSGQPLDYKSPDAELLPGS